MPWNGLGPDSVFIPIEVWLIRPQKIRSSFQPRQVGKLNKCDSVKSQEGNNPYNDVRFEYYMHHVECIQKQKYQTPKIFEDSASFYTCIQ